MSCGGCAKRGQILKQAGKALAEQRLAAAARRVGVVAASAAKSAKAIASPIRRPR